jgi:two-component system response regulator BaeR
VHAHDLALILLDLMLPGRDGLALCRDLPAFSEVPIIMTTARVEEIDRLLSLELGADDYVCKPYSPREVVARVKAVLRRHTQTARPDPGLLRLYPDTLRVHAANGRGIELTAVEFALLQTLHAAPGRIFPRDRLMDRIYCDGRIVSYRTIDSHVKKLRHRLAELLPGQELIHSVYGVGYRFEERSD